MNEEVLRSVLGEVIALQFAEFQNAPEHKFSLHHRLAMKKIFARYSRNVRKLRKPETCTIVRESNARHRLSFRQRLVIALAIILIACVLCGWVIMFFSENISGTVYPDYTKMFAENIEGSPQTVDYRYALSDVPDGFEIANLNSSLVDIYTVYNNKLTKQRLCLRQWVKSKYKPKYNTERYRIEEMRINGSMGLYIDLSMSDSIESLVVWDNGDYIIEIRANLDKERLLELCNLNKISF
ncbi:MAG: DUF4367 domain-containing protein [Oscillospiraceae bacterium]